MQLDTVDRIKQINFTLLPDLTTEKNNILDERKKMTIILLKVRPSFEPKVQNDQR